MANFKEILSVTLILFSVIDVLGSVPIIIDLRKKIGHIESGKITIISGVIMVVFLYLGDKILLLFGLDVSSFAVAGALVMFLIGMEMIMGLQLFRTDPNNEANSAIVPIAFPLVAGAGTMTTLISLRAEFEVINILIGIVVNLVFVYLVLKTCGWLERKIGAAGFNILRKVFGIILLAISIKLIKDHWFLS